jgi:hypothetical protein
MDRSCDLLQPPIATLSAIRIVENAHHGPAVGTVRHTLLRIATFDPAIPYEVPMVMLPLVVRQDASGTSSLRLR